MSRSKKAKALLILVGLAGFILTACNGTSGTKQSTESEKVDGDESSDQETYAIGDKIKLGDYVIKVEGMEDPYNESNEFLQPDAGNRYVTVEVLYENPTDDKNIDYNSWDWTLFDSDGYNYDPSFVGKDPDLSSGTLNPGGTVRGWVTFEVRSESTNFKIQFTPSWLSNDNVEIVLY